MSKKIFSFITFMVIVFGLFFIFGNKELKANEDFISFYSEKNKPIYYGATKITIDKNVTDVFDIKDSRFRIFAKDYEDGDLTHLIECVYNNVNPKTVGEYEIKYSVIDSHKNKTEITVPVIVRDKGNKECEIVRTVYAIPKMENMATSGMERCNNGDRQILGIYLPSGAKATIKALDYDLSKKYEITFFNNTRAKNSFIYGSVNETEYELFNKAKDGNYYDSVPLITSPRLNVEKIDTVYTFLLKFDDSAKALDYYHYLDNEASFKQSWEESGNSFSVVEGEAITFVVPLADIDNITKVETLDKMLEYYLEVVNRMDKMVGLSFTPECATDRNYRTKYTAICDPAVSAGAYYAGSHIAVCSPSIVGFFQYGWGSLHEIAHGYQGSFGRGVGGGATLALGETGNNVLAHYIQIDKTLYKKQDDWMGGSLSKIEENLNQKRLNSASIFHNQDGTYTNVSEKLYFIINLLDSFEKEETYAKMFSYYRKILSEFGNDKYTISEIYAKFFASEYKANIIPYLKVWGLSVSSEVESEILKNKLTTYVTPYDYLSLDELSTLKEKENISLSFGLVAEDIVKKYASKKKATIKFEIDDEGKLFKKTLAIRKNGRILKIVKLSSLENVFDDLEIGLYEIVIPNIFGYKQESSHFLVVGEDNNTFTYTYKKEIDDLLHPTKIFIRGIYPTLGYSLNFSSDYKKGSISLGGANLGNQNDVWKNKPDEVFVSVKIIKKNGEIISNLEVKGNGYFSDLKLDNTEISLEYGDKVVIYTEKPEYVLVYSSISKNNTPIEAYSVKDKLIEYEITIDGLKLLNKKDFNTKDVLYSTIKDELFATIDNYFASTNEEELDNIRINFEKKNEVYLTYLKLSEEDKIKYESRIMKMILGGTPTIKLKSSETSYKFNSKDEIDLYSLITIEDNEDIVIESNEENVEIVSNIIKNRPGNYKVKYIVRDSNNNISDLVIDVEIVKNKNSNSIYKIIIAGIVVLGIGICLFKRDKK